MRPAASSRVETLAAVGSMSWLTCDEELHDHPRSPRPAMALPRPATPAANNAPVTRVNGCREVSGQRSAFAIAARDATRDRRGSVGVDLAGPAGGLDGGAGGGAERVRVHGQRLRDLALCEDLDADVLAVAEALGLHGRERDVVAGLEARLEVLEVHGLRVRPEHLERHRLLHVRAAQLAHPHVNRHLSALEAGTVLGARARAGALAAAARRLARARGVAAADALARLAAARSGLQRVEADRLVGLGLS